MARVIISAGHTSDEPGAIQDDLREVDLTRKIAQKATAKLRQSGIITLSVPPELDLLKRIEWINNTGYSANTNDIAIEIHINDGGKSGIEGWFKGEDKKNNKSFDLTNTLVEKICDKTKLKNQGVKSELTHELKSLAFLNKINPIGALLECLYIDNKKDQEFLRDESKLDSLAEGIVDGIKDFFGIKSPAPASIPGSQPSPGQQPGTNLPTPGTASPPPVTRPAGMTPSPYGTSPSLSRPTSPTSFGGGAQGAKPQTLTREQRKEMIKKRYHQILGRKVSEQDLNYFLNLNLDENQMTKRLIESQDHADMIKNNQEYKKIKPEYDKLKTQKKELEAQLKDKDKLVQKQNELIQQKNKSIFSLENDKKAPPSEMSVAQTPYSENPPENRQQVIQPEEKGSIFERFLRKLNDVFD